MVEILLDLDFHGPTLIELEPVLEDAQEIEILWKGSKLEFALLEKLSLKKKIKIRVTDLTNLEALTNILGNRILLTREFLDTAVKALSTKSHNWRSFTQNVGISGARSAIIKITADSLKIGLRPRLTKAAIACLEGINPIDVDILLRLNTMRNNAPI